MESTARARKPKAPTLRDADWAPHKERIIQLHITDNIPLKDVKIIMERDYGFIAEIRQYRTRLSKWKLDKNVKTKEMKAIIRRSQHRDIVQTDQRSLRFKVRDQEVEREKVTRWMRAHDVDERQLYAPSSAASTPSAVEYWTMSEHDASVQSTPTQTPILASLPSLLVGGADMLIDRDFQELPTIAVFDAMLIDHDLQQEAADSASLSPPVLSSSSSLGTVSSPSTPRAIHDLIPEHDMPMLSKDEHELLRAFNDMFLSSEYDDGSTIFSAQFPAVRRADQVRILTALREKYRSELYWFCCQCKGVNNMFLSPACVSDLGPCGHRHCAICVAEESGHWKQLVDHREYSKSWGSWKPTLREWMKIMEKESYLKVPWYA